MTPSDADKLLRRCDITIVEDEKLSYADKLFQDGEIVTHNRLMPIIRTLIETNLKLSGACAERLKAMNCVCKLLPYIDRAAPCETCRLKQTLTLEAETIERLVSDEP